MPQPPRIALAAFGVSMAEVRDGWIEARCCGHTTFTPVKLIAAGGVRSLGAAVTRLRCDQCRQTPRAAALVGSAAQGSVELTGGWSGYRVEIIRSE